MRVPQGCCGKPRQLRASEPPPVFPPSLQAGRPAPLSQGGGGEGRAASFWRLQGRPTSCFFSKLLALLGYGPFFLLLLSRHLLLYVSNVPSLPFDKDFALTNF